jgi:hypothetical protein
MAQPPVPLAPGVANVVAHVPEGFDASRPIHLVLFFHGSDQCVPQLTLAGDIVCKPGTAPIVGAGLAWHHDDAGTSSIFAAPQFNLWGGGTAGRMADRGYFPRFVEELLHDTFAPGLGAPRSLDDLEDITIVAHSAGYVPLAALLDRAEVDDRVRNVVLVDATFDGTVNPYTRWLDRGWSAGSPRKLVAVYGGWGTNDTVGRALASHAEAHETGSAIVNPSGSLAEAVRTHAVTVKRWSHVEHSWMILLTMSKALEGLGFPQRPISPPRKPYGELPAPTPIATGQTLRGSLDDGGVFLENGSLYHDYRIDLAAEQNVVVELHGGRSLTEGCCNLDVTLEVLHDGNVVARDDDGGGGFDARLSLTATEVGRYVLRVSTYGSGRKRGPYELRVE